MATFLKGRVSKLETRNRPPVRVRNTVLYIDALTGEVFGKTPKGPCMVVYHHGEDDDWQQAVLSQQAALISQSERPIYPCGHAS